MGFGHHHIAPVILDVLIAAKGVGFRPCRRTAGDEVRCLVVAEAREDRIFAGKIVIEANVPGAFVELPRRLVRVVEAGMHASSRWAWDKADTTFAPIGLIRAAGMMLQGVPPVWASARHSPEASRCRRRGVN